MAAKTLAREAGVKTGRETCFTHCSGPLSILRRFKWPMLSTPGEGEQALITSAWVVAMRFPDIATAIGFDPATAIRWLAKIE